ncbi:hypothetical protein [Jeotgalicoccus sp. ATCC 8456]|uniref:hypothetical protein n=1 Tax=Jeotgalicoccus sp. ATCC 8456 TaxID=946435 RepID=UPI0018E65850|nr:hypothetical protein [Jeotgalicoccus sp. ATCC 8456]QQD85668.1 hypothetical protein JEM45_03320 [Jeotgalicoccus sp. ATCC 8456]
MFTTLVHTKQHYDLLTDYKVMDNTYIISKNQQKFNGFEVNGSGIVNDKFLKHNQSYSKNDVLSQSFDIEEIQFKMKGSVCLFIYDENETVIIPDPLGGAILFYYDSPGIKVFSNSIDNIISILSELGIEVEKDFSYFLENIATGNGGLTQSPFKNIYALKQFSFLRIDKEKVHFTINKKIKEYIKNANTRNYDEVLNIALHEIKSNLDIVSSHNNIGNKYSHLTGGFDSRLILSGLLAIDKKNEYRYFCSGSKGSPDKDISIALSKHFGLTQTNDSGQFIYKYPKSLKQEVIWSMNLTSGIIKTINPNIEQRDNVILSGGYGELMRSFYTRDNNYYSFNSFEDIVDKLWKNLNSNGLFTSNFKMKFVEKFRNVINDGLNLGFPEESILDYYYVAIRNRYFVGQISFYSSVYNSRFDPLYSCKIAIDTLFIYRNERNNNFLVLDLLKLLNEDLLYLPFDTPRINNDYKNSRENVKEIQFKDNYEIVYENINFAEKPDNNTRRQANKLDREKANKMKARLWQVVEMENMQESLIKILGEVDSHEIKENLREEKINNLLHQEINNRPDLRTLNLLYSNLVWWIEKDE